MSDSISLSLSVGGLNLVFSAPEVFAFALSGRTTIPTDKLAAFLSRDEIDLGKELNSISRLKEDLTEILTRALRDSTQIGPYMVNMEISLVSSDHGWRDIVKAVRQLDADYEEYKKIALTKYVLYLASRQEVIRMILADRQKCQNVELPDGQVRFTETQVFDPKQTKIFDLSQSENLQNAELKRLPRRETVELNLEEGQTVGLRLGDQEIKLSHSEGFRIKDEQGNVLELEEGKYIIGRDSGSHVVLAEADRSVSRQHLVIEIDAQKSLKLTDISTLGTFYTK